MCPNPKKLPNPAGLGDLDFFTFLKWEGFKFGFVNFPWGDSYWFFLTNSTGSTVFLQYFDFPENPSKKNRPPDVMVCKSSHLQMLTGSKRSFLVDSRGPVGSKTIVSSRIFGFWRSQGSNLTFLCFLIKKIGIITFPNDLLPCRTRFT